MQQNKSLKQKFRWELGGTNGHLHIRVVTVYSRDVGLWLLCMLSKHKAFHQSVFDRLFWSTQGGKPKNLSVLISQGHRRSVHKTSTAEWHNKYPHSSHTFQFLGFYTENTYTTHLILQTNTCRCCVIFTFSVVVTQTVETAQGFTDALKKSVFWLVGQAEVKLCHR